jgi:AhpD family alkylhydroperoxidase
MAQRLNYAELIPEGLRAMRGLEHYINTGTALERSLLELVRLRASLINGCTACIGLHTHELQKHNESGDRIAHLPTWRSSDAYTHRERAALAWTEAITDVHPDHVPDEIFNETREHFSDVDLANLTIAIASINAWNRMSIAFRAERPAASPRPPASLIGLSK